MKKYYINSLINNNNYKNNKIIIVIIIILQETQIYSLNRPIEQINQTLISLTNSPRIVPKRKRRIDFLKKNKRYKKLKSVLPN